MMYSPIAATFARDAVERQFPPATPKRSSERQAVLGAQPTRWTLRVAGARALRGLADRLEPRGVRPDPSDWRAFPRRRAS
jgi:hypothetical protein